MFRDALNPSVRPAKRALANRRALVEQAERMNPIQNEYSYNGSGATPTEAVRQMGGTPLSEFRGGSFASMTAKVAKKMSGSGHHSGSDSDSDSSDDDAFEGGRRLFAHMMDVKGEGFAKDFHKGMGAYTGSGFFDTLKSAVGDLDKHLRKNPAPSIGEFATNTARDVGRTLEHAVNPLSRFGLSVFGKKGGLNTGAYEGDGRMRPVNGVGFQAAGGKRTNARAAVVKKVMAEKGLSMIEASKYVKQHNLYKK